MRSRYAPADQAAHQHREPAPAKAKPVKATVPLMYRGAPKPIRDVIAARGQKDRGEGTGPTSGQIAKAGNVYAKSSAFLLPRKIVQVATGVDPAHPLDLVKNIESAHRQAVAIAHPSKENPPSLERNIKGLFSGAFGFPRMGIKEPGRPHPLLSGKPTLPEAKPPASLEELKRDPRYWDTSRGLANQVSAWGQEQRANLARAEAKPRAPEAKPSAPVVPHGKPAAAKATSKVATAKTLKETATEALKGAKQVRTSQETIRSQERAARAQAFGKALQANPTMEGARQASAHLAGKYTALHFGGFEGFTPETLDAMVKHVADHPDLRPFDQKRAITAIKKAASGKVPTKGEHKLLHQAFGPEATAQIMQSVSRLHRAKAVAYDAANLPRSLMASFDASGILRQGLMVGTGHPVMFAKNVPDYLKAIRSEKFYETGMNQLHARPNAVNGVYHKMGLELTELAPRAGAAAREESFRSPLAEKIPGVRMSGRGFTLFLDKARADLADHLYAKALKNEGKLIHRVEWAGGVPKIVKRPIDPHDPKLLESIGDVANSASGRGDLGAGAIGRSQEGLNLLLFSPRLIKSRVDFINPVWYAKLDPLARHQAYKALGGLVVLMATALEIGRATGAKVNLDPRSSDFAKIRLGNTRLDLAGGFQQYVRLLSEIATQQTVNATGKVTNLGQAGPGKTSDWDIAFRFLRSKLAPLASAAVDVSQRQNVVGQPLTFQNQVVARATPLSGQDAVSVGQEAAAKAGVPAGVLAGLGAFGLSAIGGGVQNYKPRKPKAKSKGSGSVYAPATGGSRSIYAPSP